jgi:hypothetical protein
MLCGNRFSNVVQNISFKLIFLYSVRYRGDSLRSVSDGGYNENLIIFIRGNVISGAPSIKGVSQ